MTKDSKDIKFKVYLGGENISVGGRVDYLKCAACNHESFDLRLFSETDMNYQGVVGLIDEKENILLITRLTPKEWGNYKTDFPDLLKNRINKIFNTINFEVIHWANFIDKDTKREIYARVCTNCSDYYKVSGFDEFEKFVIKGGQIIAMDGYFEVNSW